MKRPEKRKPGATLAGATGQTEYGLMYMLARWLQTPFGAVVFELERLCSRIEVNHELAKWNRTLESEQ